jgi:NAD(P)-dependent dehydrogenase (short-subunit alcohol dehydrogenase family)
MKIAITGSTKLASYLPLATKLRIEDDIDFDQYDVFINHAHKDFEQVRLLENAFNAWKDDASKLIINISSRASQPNCSKGYVYAAQKAALDHLADNLTYNSDKKCRITTLNLGLLESDLPSCTYQEVSELLEYIISMPPHLEIPRMYFQHAICYNEVQRQKAKRIK